MTAVIGALGGMYPVPTILVSIDNRTVTKSSTTSTVTASYAIQSGGNVVDQDALVLESWLDVGAATSFEVRATLVTGTTPTSGTIGAWESCGTTRTWSQTDASADGVSVTCDLLIELRRADTLAVLDSATITITAERLSLS